MAKTKISEFSTTAGNNTDINSINIAEGCAPSGINDAIRELMRQLKEFQTGGAGDSVNSGGDFSVATNKFTVASASGNTAVAGTLAVTGTTTLTGALVANGNATLGDASGDTVTIKGTPTLEVNPTLSGGTANGVAYLNGSKVVTTGSALTFDGNTTRNNQSSGTNAYFRTTSGTVDAYFGAATSGLATGVVVGSFSNNDVVFYQNSSEAMRLTSTSLYTASGINVGIGTSSPANKLSVNSGASTTTAQFTSTGSSVFLGLTNSGSSAFIGADSTGAFLVQTPGSGYATKLTVDSSGNLGLGVTPSAWASVTPVFQVNRASFYGYSNEARMSANYYYNAGEKYIASDYATSYSQSNGAHAWYTAPSGTAGDAISFTQAMTLDASGNLLVGTTSVLNSGKFSLYQTNNSFAAVVQNTSSGVSGAYGIQANLTQDPNTTDSFFYKGTGNATDRFYVRANGGIGNYQANDVNLSDRREKTNFAPAGNYLSKICAIPVQTFNYIDQSEQDPGLTLGVVAQDVQAVAPELVMESNWGTEEEPKMRLSIYQTDLQYALMKCIQEQQAQIESLTQRLAQAGI